EAESFAIMDQALELGINLIDTANVYGEPQPPADPRGEGIAEQIIGRWLAQGGRRERIVLATKVYQPMGPGPNARGLSAYHNRKDRAIELEVIPACRAYGLGLLPWRPLSEGLLAGALASPTGRPADPVRQREIERFRPQLEAYEQFCRELGEAPADVALAWLLHNPAVPALISGPETLDQLTGSTRALSIT